MKYLIMQPYLGYRGAETMSIGLARELNKRGELASVLGLYLDRQETEGVNFILPSNSFQKLFKNNKFMLWVLGTPVLFFLILKNYKNFDVLLPYNLPTSWLSVFFKKYTIWMAQGLIGTKYVDKIISPSIYLAKKIYKKYGINPVVINNPVTKTSGSVKDLPKAVLKLRKENKFVFLQVGALNSQKRQVTMLEVFKKILKFEPKCALIFVGEGIDKDKLVGKNVFTAGYVPKNKIGSYYKICDLNLLPSVNETFSGTPLEALTYGKNSLITTESGIKEVINDFAIISKPSRSEIYKNLLKYIKNKKHYDNLAIKNRNKVIKRLTWKVYLDKFMKEINLDPIDTYKRSYYESHYHTATKDLLNERETRIKRAISYLNPKKGEKILDLGVGEGDLALRLANMGVRVWGIDYSSSAIRLAKKKCGNKVVLIKADAQKIDFNDNYFDKVVAIDLVEHIYPEKLKKVLSEVKRVLKPNGSFVVETSPNTYFWYPIMFLGKIILGIKKLESEKYHINLFNYFRLKNTLSEVFDGVKVSLHNDGKNFLSSRTKNKGVTYKILKLIDVINENKFFEKSIIFGHDLWAICKN